MALLASGWWVRCRNCSRIEEEGSRIWLWSSPGRFPFVHLLASQSCIWQELPVTIKVLVKPLVMAVSLLEFVKSSEASLALQAIPELARVHHEHLLLPFMDHEGGR